MKYRSSKPIPGTTRTRIISDGGRVLEKQAVYLPPQCWAALKRLSYEQRRSGSQIIESLIVLATLATSDNS